VPLTSTKVLPYLSIENQLIIAETEINLRGIWAIAQCRLWPNQQIIDKLRQQLVDLLGFYLAAFVKHEQRKDCKKTKYTKNISVNIILQ